MSNQSYIVLDLETDGLDYRKDPIVAVGLKNLVDTTPRSFYVLHSLHPKFIDVILFNQDLLIGHNIKFDLLFLWKYPELQDWFRQGGRIWDTQLVEYMLSGQQDKYPKLRDIAVQKYGCSERTKWIDDLLFNKKETLLHLEGLINQSIFDKNAKQDLYKEFKLIESYKKVSDLPRDKVLKDVQNDVLDTEQIYLQQVQKVQELGNNFENLVMLEHDALLATAEMTYNGMMVSTQKLIENKEELEQQLVEKHAKLRNIVGKYWR